MPWVGIGFMQVQQQVVIQAPGGQPIYRLIATCGCGAKFEFLLPYASRGEEFLKGLGQISEHLLEHMK